MHYARKPEAPKTDLTKVWATLALKALAIVFLAGMGWERLSALESAINRVAEDRVIERIAVIETKLDLVLSRLKAGQ
jgi:hypothetical protein